MAASGDRPSSHEGVVCPSCGAHIPHFAELSDPQAERLKSLARSGRRAEAMRDLRDLTNCSLGSAKRWVNHPDGPEDKGFRGHGKCPHCGGRLRTEEAKQCPHCLMSWHDPRHPKRLG